MRLVASIVLLLLVGVGAAATDDIRPEMIRVAIVTGGDSLRIDGAGALISDESGFPLRAALPITVRPVSGGVSVNDRTVRTLFVASPGIISLNGKGYRGVVEIGTRDKGLLVVNELPLEEYLVGLINCEISSQWPIEAVKAQAVVARTYALYQKNSRRDAPYHLESTVLDQVYEGCDIEDSRAARAVKETAGQVLSSSGAVIQAFFHSSCGGHTEKASNVWGFPLPYLQGVDCKYCLSSPSVRWELQLPLKRIETQLRGTGINVSGLRGIQVGTRNESGRLNDVVLISGKGRQTVSAVNFRKALGYGTIKSTNFTVKQNGPDMTFAGVGYGHGVGLCQWGAKQRAGDGFDYSEILAYYYPGTTLGSVPVRQ